MSKWRAVLVGAMASGALAAGAFIPAHAERVEVPGVGSVSATGDPTTQSGRITADGEAGNPDPADGYVTAGNDGTGPDGVCADDEGSPGDAGGTPTCAP